jgi:nucleotide-binding universal stress UspA family protein
LRRILVAIADPQTGGRQAVRRAEELARRCGSSIELFKAIAAPVIPGRLGVASEQFARLEAKETVRALERMAAHLRSMGRKVDIRLGTGFAPTEAILREAKRYHADLLVIEARKHNFIAHLLSGRTDVELVRQSGVPLLVVKNSGRWRRPRVLAALGPSAANGKLSALDRAILSATQSISKWSGGSAHAVHVYPTAPRLMPGERLDSTAIAAIPARERAYAAALLGHLRKKSARYGISDRNVHIACGNPADELPRIARSRRIRIMVMGSMSHAGSLGFLVPSMPEITLKRLSCDLLIVPARRGAAAARA